MSKIKSFYTLPKLANAIFRDFVSCKISLDIFVNIFAQKIIVGTRLSRFFLYILQHPLARIMCRLYDMSFNVSFARHFFVLEYICQDTTKVLTTP